MGGRRGGDPRAVAGLVIAADAVSDRSGMFVAMANKNTFKMGDVVRLNSGGPAMTVINPDAADGDAYCTWWNDGEYGSKGFPHAALTPATPDPQPKPNL